MALTISDCAIGVAVWLVWHVAGNKRLVYPCKIVDVLGSIGADTIHVIVRSYQDNGYMEDAVSLQASALQEESVIKVPVRRHLDWSFRSAAIPGETDFKQAQLNTGNDGAGAGAGPSKRPRLPDNLSDGNTVNARLARCEEQLARNAEAHALLEAELITMKGKLDSWDVTIKRMQEYQRQQAALAEDVRKLKQHTLHASVVSNPPAGGGVPESPEREGAEEVGTVSDPLCAVCKKAIAYDMPMSRLLEVVKGQSKVDMRDLFTANTGAVKAKSPLKKLVTCDKCMPAGSLKMVVCTSGGAGNRLTCDWCRCSMTVNTTDGRSMWCGAKAHSNCRGLVIENETDRQANTSFLAKGLAPVKDTVPYDEVKLIDVNMESWNDADYVVVAMSALSKALVILEIDATHETGGYTPESEAQKNDGNFACGAGFDRVLFLRIKPSGEYTNEQGERGNMDKKGRWLIARDWVVTFLRAPYGAWSFPDKTLVYLMYDAGSRLIDRRPDEFHTVVAYGPPALPDPCQPELSDFACTLDPYLVTKGSAIARTALSLSGRVVQPGRG
jgi:hypothetical protein